MYIDVHTGGIHSVMDFIVGNGHSKPSSNPGQGCLHYTKC